MNGSAHPSPGTVDIKLKRGSAGLGFNIVGGVDQQYVVNDNGIYVSKLKEDGAAALDGRLQEGDKILAINGVALENLTHRATVDLFRTAGEHVELRVLKKFPNHVNGPTGSRPEPNPPVSSLEVLVALGAVVAVCAVLFMRLRKKHF
ncbi:synaptojanin-2-binding protein [Gasterosteus aculeatus]|uniref:Synaptojanin-2-binding protein n=2 Tax=Gasterosteus aculeatus TaxID=69293 RepID=A0AAQ4NS98_GASAC|nr:synaptojanin-2-binding protein [Gasterosteus aculeatus aculeatus]